MAPQLYPLGKKLFMEHILSKNKISYECFLRSLLINKRFLNIANNHRIYKIHVSLKDEKKICLMFASYTDPFFGVYGQLCTFEFVCCILKLLKPSFTKFKYDYIYHEEVLCADSLLTLMQLAGANGKVIFDMKEFGDEQPCNFLKHVYEYVDELECAAVFLEQISTIQFKLLDKLTSTRIGSNEQLNIVLRHPAKQLILVFYEDFEDDLDVELVQLHKNDTKQCKLLFCRLSNADQIYQITQNVLNAVDQLETLDIKYESQVKYDMNTFAMILNEISQLYQMFATLIEMIRQSYPNPALKINFDFCQYCAVIKIKLPEDWQKQIKKIGGLQNAVLEETLDKSQQYFKRIDLQVKTDLTNAKFVIYGLVGDQEEEMEINGDDVSDEEEME